MNNTVGTTDTIDRIARRKWLWNFASVLYISSGVAPFAEANENRKKRSVPTKKKSTGVRKQISRLAFSGIPYRTAVKRVAESLETPVLIDRRLDPDSTIELMIHSPTDSSDIFQKLASFRNAVALEWNDLIFLTPEDSVEMISMARRNMTAELKQASPGVKTSLLRKRKVRWPDYSQPRRLIGQWCEKEPGCGGIPEGLAHIPYDLIAAAELPPMTLADRVTLIAVQYGVVPGITENGTALTLRRVRETDS
ncbi:MAG: hypothetical protein Q4C47_04190 [Planctomycetia bacterium]|nr:hypothetical protein [Planctomycetia bacterium]